MNVKRFSNCLSTISSKALRISMSTGVAISSFCDFLFVRRALMLGVGYMLLVL